MKTAPSGIKALLGHDIRAIKDRFYSLNRKRLHRMRQSLRAKQQDFLDVLPLLFHINHPSLPGFVNKDMVAGISDYSPGMAELEAAKRISNGFSYRRRMLHTYDIYSIFLMGSSGTIAHSTKSDFDVWVCHRPALSAGQLEELRSKCNAIEKWANELNLEVHFFLMDADSFRAGNVLDLTGESSGTAQHHLLLDEFYRTGLLVAGRYPLWWLVPAEEEQNYSSYVAELKRKRLVRDCDAIDFGGLGNMPAEEFFGAAVWHIYKGIDSPYKSVLKILLMEVYANGYPEVGFLALQFKNEVYGNNLVLDKLDPYVMLLDRLTEYLIEKDEEQRLNLVRRCFYFKANQPMSKLLNNASPNWQQQVMLGLIKEWGWGIDYLEMLDARNVWKIDKVLDERKILVDELTHCYFFVSDFARKNARLTMISKRDLNILGRKLYAAFERKAGKIEIVNRGISPNLQEGLLALHQNVLNDRESWHMMRGHGLSSEHEDSTVLKRSPNLVELIAWCFFNKIIDIRSVFSLSIQDSDLTNRELHSIVDTLHQCYPNGELSEIGMNDLLNPPRLISVNLFVNVGHGPNIRRNRLGHLISDRSDALSYGGAYENLVQSVDAVYVTSWQEVYVFHYTGVSGLLDCLCQYMQWNPLEAGIKPPRVSCNCFSSGYGTQIARRVGELFNNIANTFYESAHNHDVSYIVEAERSYAMLYVDSDVLTYKNLGTYSELLSVLSLPQPSFRNVVMDQGITRSDVLSSIYRHNKADVIQVFFHVVTDSLNIYVLDENGSLFNQSLPAADAQIIFSHIQVFLRSVLKRKAASAQSLAFDSDIEGKIEFYQAGETGRDCSEFKHVNIIRRVVDDYFSIQVLGDDNNVSTDFTIYCGDKEFSSSEYGKQLFPEIAKYIMQQRLSGQRYPIYITDIDISPAMLGVESSASLQTIHYLNYKKKIENKLNQALRDL